MKKFLKIGFIVVLVFGLFIILGLYYVRNAGARDIKTEDVSFTISSNELKSEFNNDAKKASIKFQNKAIEVSGSITEINDSVITLDESIFCKMNVLDASIKTNDKILVKGRVVGFDDLFGDVKLDECTIIK